MRTQTNASRPNCFSMTTLSRRRAGSNAKPQTSSRLNGTPLLAPGRAPAAISGPTVPNSGPMLTARASAGVLV